MAKDGGKLLIKYRDPVAASFSSKDIVMNVQTGTLFYKRNRKLFALRGTPDNFDLVVFPGQSTNQQILINDNSGTLTMTGTDQFRFKVASATCGCANYFYVGAETLTHFSGSVRIGEQLPGTCNLLNSFVDPALLVHGNMEVSASAGGIGNIAATGNISASLDLFGTNTYINNSLIHVGNTDTKLTFGTDTINLYSDGSNIATVSSDRFTVNGTNDLYIPGTDSAPSSGTSVLLLDNTTGQVYRTGSYGGETFKATGKRIGRSEITGSLNVSSSITSSNLQLNSLNQYPGVASSFSVLTIKNGNVHYTSSNALGGGGGGGTDVEVKDEGGSLSAAAESINFVGNAVVATANVSDITVTINAVTKSLWYDGSLHPSLQQYISSSNIVLMDKEVGIGEWKGSYGNIKHNLHISSSNLSSSIGFANSDNTHWSTGVIKSTDNIFHISDHGTSNTDTGTQVLKIYGTGSGNLLSSPEAISIHSGLRSGGATPNPTFIGATDVNIPSIMIDPVGTGSLAKLHINTMGTDDGLLYNGLCVGPYFNPTVFPNQNSGSGVFIHLGEDVGGDIKATEVPRITGKTELGSVWRGPQSRGLLITAEGDRSIGYPGGQPQFGNAVQKASVMEFKVKDVGKQAYSASLSHRIDLPPYSSSFNLGAAPDSASMSHVYGQGEEWIMGMMVNPRIETDRDSNILYTFKNDLMPLLSIEASGRIGIGNFHSGPAGGQKSPKALLDITAKSGSDADILLATQTSNIPLIKLEVQNFSSQNMSGTSTKLFNPNFHRGEFYMHTDYASGNFYLNQKSNSVVIESKGKQEGLAGQTYPFDIKGAAANNFKAANNIQLVVGGDNSPNRDSSISSSHIRSGLYPSYSNNQGRAALTVEGISDFRRFGEVGIGLSSPSSSLHVTRSVQANNFRTTNPVDIPITGTNPSIQPTYGSNQLSGSNTNFISDFKVGDAIKISGRSIIATPQYQYAITSSHVTASVKPVSVASTKHQTFVNNDLILITVPGSGEPNHTGSFHSITNPLIPGTSGSSVVFDSRISFLPAYIGPTTASYNLIHRLNPHHYQIATVENIFSDTSMSISQNWEGITWSGSLGYKEDILFQVKTADYRPVFTIQADGTTLINGSVGTFKSTGQRNGDSAITGSLTLTGNISSSGTLFSSSSLGFDNISIYNSSSGQYFYTSSQGLSEQLDTFKVTGQRNGDASITGSLIVTGNITAQEFHTEFISSSIIFESGSTQFGNSSDDTHTFSGSINVKDEGHITASGNISASGHLFISASNIDTPNLLFYNTVGGELTYSSTSSLLAGTISSSAQIATDISGSWQGQNFISSSGEIATDISGSWQGQNFISASQTFLSTGQRNGDSAITGSLDVTNNITASGNISASGTLYASASLSDDANLRVLVYDTATGLLSHTGSYGGAGGGGLLSTVNDTSGQVGIDQSLTAGALSAVVSGLTTTSNVQFNNLNIDGTFDFADTGTFNNDITVVGNKKIIFNTSETYIMADNANPEDLQIYADEDILLMPDGQVGIGTTSPGEKLEVVGNISASGLLFASSSVGNYSDIVVQDLTTGRFYTTSSAALTTTLPVGILSSSTQIATDISGSWQGQEFVSASQTFLSTGQRNGDSAITGSLDVTNNITASGNISASGVLFGGLTKTPKSDIVVYNEITGELSYKDAVGLVSSSTQIAAAISGALGTVSSSIAIDLNNLTSNISGSWQGQNFISSSGEIATDISGSWQGQNFISASQTFLSTGQRNGDSGITGSLTISGNGDLLITGSSGNIDIISQVASETGRARLVLNTIRPGLSYGSSTLFKSGSQTFFDVDESYKIRPNSKTALEIGGNGDIKFVSSSVVNETTYLFGDASTERIGIGTTTPGEKLTVEGNISASGTLHAGLAAATPTDIAYYNTTNGLFTYGPALGAAAAGTVSSSAQISSDISGSWQGQNFISSSQTFLSTGQRSGDSAITGSLDVTSHITSSGNISSSGTILSHTGQFYAGGIISNGRINTNSHITASGNISASGHLFASASLSNNSNYKVSVYDESTGKFFYTGSYGAAGGGGIVSSVNNTSGQVGIDLSIDGSGVLTATANALDTTNNVQFNNLNIDGTFDFADTGTFNDDITIVGGKKIFFDSTATYIYSDSSNPENLYIGADDDIILQADDDVKIQVGGTEYVRFDGANKRLGIGISSPGEKLEVIGNISSSGGMLAEGFKSKGKDAAIWNGSTMVFGHYQEPAAIRSSELTLNQGNLTLTHATDGHITASGNISASGTLHAGLTAATPANIAYYDTVTGLFTYGLATGASGFTAAGISGSLGGNATLIRSLTAAGISGSWQGQNFISSSGEIATDISGSWQGQNFISASQTFLSTGQRNGDSAITGSLTLEGPSNAGLELKINGNGSTPIHLESQTNSNVNIQYQNTISSYYAGIDSNNVTNRFIIGENQDLSASPQFVVKSGGNVGINTFSPTQKLHVDGNITASGWGHFDEVSLTGNDGTKGIWANNTKNYLSPYSHDGDMWIRSKSGRFTFQTYDDGDSWTRTYQLHLPDPGGVNVNTKLAEFGQRTSNTANGTYKGTRIVKYEDSTVVDGELQVGHITASGNITGSLSATASFGRLDVGGRIFAPSLDLGDASNILYYDDSTGEISFQSPASTAFSIGLAGDNATTQNMNNGDQLKVLGTAPISTTVASSDTVTISHDNIGAGAGTYGSTASGTKIHNIVIDAQGHVTSVSVGATGDIEGITTVTNSGLIGGATSGTPSLQIDYNGSDNFITSAGVLNGVMSTFDDSDKFAVVDVGSNPDIVQSVTGAVLKTWIQGFTSNNSGDITGISFTMDDGGVATDNSGAAPFDFKGGVGLRTTEPAANDLQVNLDFSNLPEIVAADLYDTDDIIILDGGPTVQAARVNLASFTLDHLSGLDVVDQVQFDLTGNVTGTTSIDKGGAAGGGTADFSLVAQNGIAFVGNDTDPGGAAQINFRMHTNYEGNFAILAGNTYNTSDQGNLNVDGDVIAYSSSDKHLKDNIIPIGSPLKKLLKIGGYEFDWNDKQDTYEGHDYGVIAQEVEKILPEAVTTRKNGYKSVKYEKIIPLLIESIKDQQKQIDELKELVNKLTK